LPESRSGPQLAIVAGPNGSGKSTFFNTWLKPEFPVFVNADEIAALLRHLPEKARQIAATQQAEAERNRLIGQRTSFAFETVFSRTEYWLRFIEDAKERGFLIRLFFLCTDDPLLNAARVETRVREGGHSVPLEKISARYPGSIRTAVQAIGLVDKLWLFDNSRLNESARVVAAISAGNLVYRSSDQPRWTEPFFRRLDTPTAATEA
jgi:predicted ABC-type ATPase